MVHRIRPWLGVAVKGTSIQSELLRVFHETSRLRAARLPSTATASSGTVRSGASTASTPRSTRPSTAPKDSDPILPPMTTSSPPSATSSASAASSSSGRPTTTTSHADLGARLTAAGFVKEDDEALILGEAGPLAVQEINLPDGLIVRAVDGKDDFDRIRHLYRRVWGDDPVWVSGSLYERWQAQPETMDVVVIEESRDGPVLCSARSEYDDSPFTGLWGGSTDPDCRGRGLYRATLLHRARLGLARGKDFVRVDASPDSEPILRRLGLHRVATTTPYLLTP